MPVYNAGSFLMEAIESILSQTYGNFELIIVDDASKDDSLKILKGFANKDKRIKVFRNKERLGVSASANRALSKASGDFIARMDADDVSFPERLALQVSYLLSNPRVIVVGGQCQLINKEGSEIGEKRFPVDNTDIRKMIFSSVPIQQPALMVRKDLLPKGFVWYESGKNLAEELDLLFRLFMYGKAANLAETILKYRIHGGNTSLLNPKRTFLFTVKTRIRAIFKYGYKPTFAGLVITLGQILVVSVLPNRFIFPVYAFFRGLKKVVTTVVLPIKPALAKIGF